MIFSQYAETCEAIIDDPKTGGDDIKNYAKKAIRNIFHTNINVHSRRLISEFPIDGRKCIEKLQSHFANMNFLTKVYMAGHFNRSHIKEWNLQRIKIKDSRRHTLCQFM